MPYLNNNQVRRHIGHINIIPYISSTKVDERERIATAEKIKKSFTSNLIVKIMSQDGNVIVDRENISTFLGRISTSRLLMNVSIASLSTDDTGQINSLYVREIYRK